jgi:hypothetical protein
MAALLLGAFAGTLAELLLLEHDEDTLQLVPLILLGVGVLLLAWSMVRPGHLVLRLFQATMVAFIVAAVAGLILHYRANVEFQRELDPTMAAMAAFWKALAAKAPPALAPAIMAQLGLVGLIYTYRHPALTGGMRLQKEEGE